MYFANNQCVSSTGFGMRCPVGAGHDGERTTGMTGKRPGLTGHGAGLEDQEVEAGGQGGTGKGAGHGNPAVPPAARAFAFNRQNGVSKAGAEVTGGVQGITCCSAKRHADRHDKAGYRP